MHYDVCVLGLGYIGLPTALLLAESGLQVLGVDIDTQKLSALRNQQIDSNEPQIEELLESTLISGAFSIAETPHPASAFIVAVPTPLASEQRADLSFVHSAINSIIPLLRGGDLLVIESTCPPGTTEFISRTIFDQRPDLEGELLLAYCPERILPGKAIEELQSNDRTIGGLTEESARRASDLYANFCSGELLMTDATTAETVKLVENAYRDVNIAFANELSLIADKIGVNPWEVISFANRHPRVNVLSPGPGVGGHCIAVDPWFLAEVAPAESTLIKTARQVNSAKPDWVVQQIEKYIRKDDPSSVLLLGLAYKPDIDDLRESPSMDIAQRLAAQNPTIEFVAVEPNLGAAPPEFESDNLKWSPGLLPFEDFDIVAWLVDHSEFKGSNHQEFAGYFLDFRGSETRGV